MRVGNFLIVGIVALILVSGGCLTSDVKKELQSAPPQSESGKVSLGQAIDALNKENGSTPPRIYYIRGVDLASNGTAREWTLGVMQGDKTFFFDYNSQKGSSLDWPVAFHYQEIRSGQYMSPETLLESHKLLIQDITRSGTIAIAELELIDGAYSLSIQANNQTALYRFDAVTGKEIL